MACRYVKRKTRESFRLPQTPETIDAVWHKGLADFEVVKRQAIVYSLYQRKHKSIMVRVSQSNLSSLLVHVCMSSCFLLLQDLPFKDVMQESADAADRRR